jgi:hypothetical protein
MKRRRDNIPESSMKKPLVPGDPGTANAGEEINLPAGYSYIEPDPLHKKITVRLKEIASGIFEEAEQDPKSQANEILRAMVINQLAGMEPDFYHRQPTAAFAEERRRGVDLQRQAELDKHNLQFRELLTTQLQIKVNKLRAELQEATAKIKQGEPLDHEKVYRRIAEIVGLEDPLQPASL